MSSIIDISKRQVLPRWLSYSSSTKLRLLLPSRSDFQMPTIEIENTRPFAAWEEEPDLANALDLVSEALALQQYGNPSARSAAELIIREIPDNLTNVRAIAEYFLVDTAPEPALVEREIASPTASPRSQISLLRSSLRRHPIDPISWSDLSLYHAIAGNRDKSLEAMRIALGMASSNRFILRSAARCFVHFGEPDRALYILRNSGLCDSDPWITATEVAVAEQASLRSRCQRRGHTQLADDNFTYLARSELAAAMSTLELAHGSTRKARKLMEIALRDPTENTAAQAEWMSEHVTGLVVPEPKSLLASFEAVARHHYHSADYFECVNAAQRWSAYQPFSSSPLTMASFVAGVALEDDARAIEILRSSTLVSPSEPLLSNNLAFSLIRSGAITNAIHTLRQIPLDSLSLKERSVLTATYGLLAFRTGDPAKGRSLYEQAIRDFVTLSEHRAVALARTFWALEEAIAGTELAKPLSKEALKHIHKLRIVELSRYRDRLAQSAGE